MSNQDMPAALAQCKAQLRRDLLERRQAASQNADASKKTCTKLSELLRKVFGAELTQTVLSGYIPIRGELDPLVAMTLHPGPVALPVVRAKGEALEFHQWHPGCAMVEGAFKTLIPAQPALLVPQALIVPLVAFDRHGFRLGYGGGFYDRTLEQLRASGRVLAIGFGYDVQEVDQVPIEATDQQLDLIITPTRIIRPDAPYRHN